jgi:hypothetical protein
LTAVLVKKALARTMSLIKSFALLALVALAAGQVQIKTKAKKFQLAVAQDIISREGT